MRVSRLLIKPLITEKSVSLASQGRYSFKVDMAATKNAVAREVEQLYKVDVVDVYVSVLPGKLRRKLKTKLHVKTPKWKKATVVVKKGQSIDIFPKEQEK